ncbi:UDP-4-amino-4,6-dideoxy-N-acetyl-beta-L-altrosamine transaminase [Shinella sp. H4-D48]|uniref:UDP-4-amino-4, 6-dideoxy-N-acetyl-beta-L-altrosamine transaminase n=1 Tax=Shinella sp. H4-D48 TaxID=2925841 RepID=UPI001F52C4BA|nr:UDP-4-amino-4,6-dideoxy-N-acetyl-beta-L-altrosamine transaminase [Shinella sp. H4-D48]UNK38227.1 UDP-4-amino-4,6-dideoxy-N-acetyl-beta-L-altrosamine transaminase [Shinella sp. H4-D48]
MIPYGRQDISQDDIDAVIATLTSDFLTQGPAVPAFEAVVADHCGVRHAVAVNSATSALHIACLALGVGPGDVVWTSPITFVASANCALYCGADVDFVDIDDRTWNMCPQKLAAKLEQAKGIGKLPKVVVPVHLCGQSCDMAAIGTLAKTYGFKIIEDASHAIGAEYAGAPVGKCTHSDIAVFSFHPVKIITTAEGGLCTTNDAALARSMQLFRSHGITRDGSEMTHASDGPWYYQQVALGLNYRITDIQAALGLSQMSRLGQFVARRREIAARYEDKLKDSGLQLPTLIEDAASSWHLYVIRVQSELRRRLFEGLRKADIGVNVHYIPVPSQPHYRNLGHDPALYPAAAKYYAEAISIPVYASMTEKDVDYVAAQILRLLDQLR